MDIKKNIAKIKYLRKVLENATEHEEMGTITVSHSNGCVQYYRYLKGHKTYLSKKKDTKQIKRLAQKRYNSELLTVVKKQQKILKEFASRYDETALEQVYDKLNPEYKKLVISYTPGYKEVGRKWASASYKKKKVPDKKIYLTDNGEYVRSKSELIIANKLKAMGISYRYECMKFLEGYGCIYPDFTILNPANINEELILEHFGMMDNPEYVQNFIGRIKAYAKNGIFPGIGLICTFETSYEPMDIEYLDKLFSVVFDKKKELSE